MQHETVTELLAAWDAGESIWSVELGGLGPGYEQAIQVAAVEMARDGKDMQLTGDKEKDNAEWDRICTGTVRKFDEHLGGISGAQYGAARWLAYQWVHNGGPAKLQERAKEQGDEDRCILVSNDFPHVPPRTTEDQQ